MVVQIGIVLVEETCITCGITFAVPERYQRHLKEKHEAFYCPNGHDQYYPAQTEAEELRKKLRAERVIVGDLRDENYRLEKQRDGALDTLGKLKKRVNAGVCPHCRRHFANLERHIHNKHKDKL